jgi:hypothetical protein
MIKEPKCWTRKCKWFIGVQQPRENEVGEFVNCEAFPDGIPNEIAYGDDPHAEVKPGQVGDYVYEKE